MQVRLTSNPSHKVPLQFCPRQKINWFSPERTKTSTVPQCEQQNRKLELPGSRGCLNQQVMAARGEARQQTACGEEEGGGPPTPADAQGRGHHCPLVPWSRRGEEDGPISHQPTVARPTMARRAPQHRAETLPGSHTPSQSQQQVSHS